MTDKQMVDELMQEHARIVAKTGLLMSQLTLKGRLIKWLTMNVRNRTTGRTWLRPQP